MLDKALNELEATFEQNLVQLADLVRIPGVSANPAPDPDLERSAAAVAEVFREAGLENAEVIQFPGGHPYVYGEWLHAEGAPTVLLYGHHDVMPPGRPEEWLSPAFEPTERDGRLYGRGAVDDKAGIMMHVAAIRAWLRGAGRLPINVKFIVEGEEETGSDSLEAFLERYRARLSADVIVLTDTANLDEGIPSLTVALRGLVGVGVEVTALDHPIHSGMWGGPIPDPVMGLCKLIAELTDEEGRLLPSFWDHVRQPTEREREDLAELPFDEARFRSQVGLEEGVRLIGDPEMPVWGRIWRQPAVTVVAFEARPIAGSTNQIIESARARISVRIVADMEPSAVQDLLVHHFETRAPWGLRVRVDREATARWWMTEPTGPAFAAAARSLQAGYGRKSVHIGCGGSIPFVEPFAKVLGGAPALLMGVEDPTCNAHGENESLNIEDWKRGTRASVHLYAELAGLDR